MTKAERVRGWIAPLFAFALAVVISGEAKAQAPVVTGKVTNEQGAPVAGANVFIKNLNMGSATNSSGNYTITLPADRVGQQLELAVRFIGFTPTSRPITVQAGTRTENFVLKADPFRLEQVVVTGVAEATSTKNLPFSVASVNEAQIKSVPASNPVEALVGKVAGAKVQLGVGNPGAAPVIRLRGSTNLSVGGSTPLIYLDGVIVRNNIADIDAQDIESIEVLKGAAAASFYGSDAANGVIAITTKRGKNLAENKVSVTARSEYGQSGIAHWVSLAHDHAYLRNADGTIAVDSKGTRIVNPTGMQDQPYPTSGDQAWRNQLQTWLADNSYYMNDVQVGLRRAATNFNGAFSNDHNGGVLPFRRGQFKRNARLNVDQGLGDKADASVSLTYGVQNNDYPVGSAAGWFELLQAPPDINLQHPSTTDTTSYYPQIPTYASPNARANPLYQLANEKYSLRRERILGGASIRYRPFDWARLEASYGTDRLNSQNQTYQFRGYLGESGNVTDGYLDNGSANNVAWNSQLSGTATKLFMGDLLSTTRVAYQLENSVTNSFDANGGKFNVNDVIDLQALDPTQINISSGNTIARTTDYMASQAFTLKDRYIVDGLYRRDGSSLFGPNSRWSNFYRISGAYRLTEDFQLPGIQELKLRAARGTAGLRPGYSYQYETYSVSNGTIGKSTLGNKSLKPAILTENEYGLNMDFLDRFSSEVVYADRTTKGAFLQVPLSRAQSNGFSSQWQNAANIGSKSLELSLQTRVIERPDFGYDITLTGDHTTQKILWMNRAPFRVSADGAQGQNVFFYKAGEPLGIIYGTRWVRSFAELQQNATYKTAQATDYVVNPLGYLVAKANRGLPSERPIAFVDSTGNSTFVIGDVNPDFNFGWSNDFRYRHFNVHALFDGQKGGKIYNFSKQWMFQDLRSGDMDQAGKDSASKIAQGFYSAGLYNGLNANDYFVENGGYMKLRELSVAYTMDERLVQKIGFGRATGAKLALIGRNLYTWTKYTGFDPDVTSGGDFNYRIDGFKYPNFRTITAQVELQF